MAFLTSLAVNCSFTLQLRRVRAWAIPVVRSLLPSATLFVLVFVSDMSHARGEERRGEPDVAAGLFRRYCQSCHGADGAGRRGADEMPNFTSHAWQKQRDDAELLVSILDGKGTVMPSFQDRLSETQARGLVAHVRSFAPAVPTTPAKNAPSVRLSGNDFTAQFRKLQDEFDELQGQLRELDSSRHRPSTALARDDRARGSGADKDSSQSKQSGKASGTNKQASSTAAGQRRASSEDRKEQRESEELADRIHPLFKEKCAQCHDEHVSQPKGKFGYILDLERVRSNPKLVVPVQPDESKLWVMIRDNEMPPEDSPVRPLTAKEKGLVHDWIAAGAPIAMTYSPAADSEPPSRDTVSSPLPAHASPASHRLLRWLGKLHIPVIHFPLALFLAAAAGELWCMLWRWRAPWSPVRFCVLLGAAGSAVAAALGWLHSDFGGYGAGSSVLLSFHRWLGIIGSCSAAAAAVASEIDSRRGRCSLLFRFALFAAAFLIGAAGHFGGSMIHGADFFAW